MTILDTLFTEARNGATNLTELIRGRGLRLGVTGLSRAGKTVFITALARQLARSAGPAKTPCPPFASPRGPRASAEGWSRSPTITCRVSPMRTISPP